jgi:hypothetical protein
MAVANRVGGLALGLLEAFFVKFYQYVVDPAPADSWPFRLFAYLAKGPFRCAPASDHPYRATELSDRYPTCLPIWSTPPMTMSWGRHMSGVCFSNRQNMLEFPQPV